MTSLDLVGRVFRRDRPNELWVTDITEHPTREGKIYCCVVLDTFSRKVVGWSIDSIQTASLVLNALGMATQRRPERVGLVIHSDRGVQFTSWALAPWRPPPRQARADTDWRCARRCCERYRACLVGWVDPGPDPDMRARRFDGTRHQLFFRPCDRRGGRDLLQGELRGSRKRLGVQRRYGQDLHGQLRYHGRGQRGRMRHSTNASVTIQMSAVKNPGGVSQQFTPARIAAATAALPGCKQAQPGTTLKQLEQEAATPLGIEC